MANKKLLIACNIDRRSGEGRLAHAYIKQRGLNINDKDLVCLTPSFTSSATNKLNFPTSRIAKYCGVYFWLWLNLFKCGSYKQGEIFILNYLPIWNFVTFLLMPKSAHVAPLTGGGTVNSKHLYGNLCQTTYQRLIRNVLQVILTKISAFIIERRGLDLLPATPFVSPFLNKKNDRHFFISTDLPVPKVNGTQLEKQYDLIAYTNDHPLKNNQLLAAVIGHVCKQNMRVAIIANGKCKKLFSNFACDLYENISHKEVATLLKKSHAALVCSLEGAGLFAQEAATHGLRIFCFPDTGASFVPGADILCERNERPSARQIADIIGTKKGVKPSKQQKPEMVKLLNEAKIYFTADH